MLFRRRAALNVTTDWVLLPYSSVAQLSYCLLPSHRTEDSPYPSSLANHSKRPWTLCLGPTRFDRCFVPEFLATTTLSVGPPSGITCELRMPPTDSSRLWWDRSLNSAFKYTTSTVASLQLAIGYSRRPSLPTLGELPRALILSLSANFLTREIRSRLLTAGKLHDGIWARTRHPEETGLGRWIALDQSGSHTMNRSQPLKRVADAMALCYNLG